MGRGQASLEYILTYGWALIVIVVAIGVVGSLLAGLYPAWRMARASPAAALREE